MSTLYRIEFPGEAVPYLQEAVRLMHNLLHGDASMLYTFRDKDARGIPLDHGAIEEVKAVTVPGVIKVLRTSEDGEPLQHTDVSKALGILATEDPWGGGPLVEEATAGEVRAISFLCDFYSRYHIGQLTYALDRIAPRHSVWWGKAGHRRDALEDYWKHRMFRLEPSASLGVGHPAATEGKDALFSIHQVLRHRLAWDSVPKDHDRRQLWSVDFDKPMQHCHKVPMTTIEAIGQRGD